MTTPSWPRRSVFVEELKVEARVGVHHGERSDAQPLLVKMEVEIEGSPRTLGETVDYALLAERAAELGQLGHIDLIETYAERLADICLMQPAAVAVCVEVRKPRAIAAGMAGVRISKRRTSVAHEAFK
jgi:dihydroneopterin aldolase